MQVTAAQRDVSVHVSVCVCVSVCLRVCVSVCVCVCVCVCVLMQVTATPPAEPAPSGRFEQGLSEIKKTAALPWQVFLFLFFPSVCFIRVVQNCSAAVDGHYFFFFNFCFFHLDCSTLLCHRGSFCFHSCSVLLVHVTQRRRCRGRSYSLFFILSLTRVETAGRMLGTGQGGSGMRAVRAMLPCKLRLRQRWFLLQLRPAACVPDFFPKGVIVARCRQDQKCRP